MKKICLILVIAMLLTLCACGSDEGAEIPASTPVSGSSTPAPEATPEPEEPSVETEEEPSEEMAEETPEAEPQESLKDIAMGFVGEQLSELIAAIGEPETSDYAPSCLGDGEDGNLYYEGFTVYTYREGDSETVEYVE